MTLRGCLVNSSFRLGRLGPLRSGEVTAVVLGVATTVGVNDRVENLDERRGRSAGVAGAGAGLAALLCRSLRRRSRCGNIGGEELSTGV
jgi:hypothetical protein